VNRVAGWLSLAFSLAAMACAGVNPAPITSGMGGAAGGAPASGAGGGGGHVSGIGGSGVTVGVGGNMCGMQTYDINRKPVEIFLVVDRSASMEDDAAGNAATTASPSKWSQLIPALSTAIQQADPTISWGMKAFPEKGGGSCANDTVTSKIDVQITTGNAGALRTAVMGLIDNGDGTPTGAAIRVATTYLQQLAATDDSRKYILLATDGEPSCAGSPPNLKSDSTGGRTDAIAAVTAAATAGFHTFVVGVATTKVTDATTLNDLAVAGLEPSPDARPGATRFYLASNQQQLVTTLESIVNPVASNCVFPLSSPPPVPENIAVKVNGTKSPQDKNHADGWDYTDAAYTGVQVYGSWCDMIKNNGNKVEIIYGCKDVIIP
jgi:hypothetical protein